MISLLATWPNVSDTTAIAVFLVLALALPGLGYVLTAFDIYAWLRSLRRALIVVTNYLPHLPAWARQETPRCLAAFGLSLPCNEEQLLEAYRKKVKQLHPDRGGDRRRFMMLQQHFETAMELVERMERQRE